MSQRERCKELDPVPASNWSSTAQSLTMCHICHVPVLPLAAGHWLADADNPSCYRLHLSPTSSSSPLSAACPRPVRGLSCEGEMSRRQVRLRSQSLLTDATTIVQQLTCYKKMVYTTILPIFSKIKTFLIDVSY